jgi:hypothetical protein
VKYSSSFEIDKPVLEKTLRVEHLVVDFVSERIGDADIKSIDLDIGYVPIIMIDPHNRYPARTRLVIKRRVLESAPKLDYEQFVKSSDSDAAKIYMSGLLSDLPRLRKLGLSTEDYDRVVGLFEGVLRDVQIALGAPLMP